MAYNQMISTAVSNHENVDILVSPLAFVPYRGDGNVAVDGTLSIGSFLPITDVLVVTTGLDDTNTGDLTVLADVTSSSANALTLQANHNIALNAAVSVASLVLHAGTGDAVTQSASGIIGGTGSLTLDGAFTTTLSQHNTYSGGTTIIRGDIELGYADSAGGGAITFGSGTHKLTLDFSGTLDNTLAGFTTGDTLDLTTLPSRAVSTYYDPTAHQLTVFSGSNRDVLQFDSSFTLAAGIQFNVSDDGSGHALVGIGHTPGVYEVTSNASGGHDITLSKSVALTVELGTDKTDNVFYTGWSPLTLPADIENVTLDSPGGLNWALGNALANTFTVKSGSWQIDGLSGQDTAVFDSAIAAHSLTQRTFGIAVLGAEGEEDISHVQTLQFTDGTVTLDTSHNAAEIFSVYQAAFGRQPDLAGESFWLGVLNGNVPETTIAAQFAASPEFAQRYGANTTNDQFLTALYQNVLGRAPDAAGDDFWLGQLARGESRAQLLIDFADSAENQGHVVPIKGQGVMVEHLGAAI